MKTIRVTQDNPPRRWEPPVIGILAISLLVIPPVVSELYPFSLPTMFSDAPRQLCSYTVTDEEGNPIDLGRVALHVRSWHDPPAQTLGRDGYGRSRKYALHIPGQVAAPEAIEAAVHRAWADDPSLPDALVVRQEVYAQGPEGIVERVADRTWRWERHPVVGPASGLP